VAALVVGCVPSLVPCVLDGARGRVVDRDTGEPIAGATVIEWWRGAGRMGGPQPDAASLRGRERSRSRSGHSARVETS
jgi:hypothetical protein